MSLRQDASTLGARAMMPRRLMTAGLLFFFIAGCSSHSDTPKVQQAKSEPARPAELTNTTPIAEVARATPTDTSRATVPSEPATNASGGETPRSPYEGLAATQVALYEKVAKNLLEPVAKAGTDGFRALKADEHRANAIMRFCRFNISLNSQAEKRLRATLNDVNATATVASEYRDTIWRLWSLQRDNKPFPLRRHLTAVYEKALDEGVEFPPEIRRTLGVMARSEGVGHPNYDIRLETLSDDLRTKLLEQTVTGEYLYQLAYAVRERGDFIQVVRAWLKSFHDLVDALPPSHRNELLMRLAWDDRKESDITKQRNALKVSVLPTSNSPLDDLKPSVILDRDVLEKKAVELKIAYTAIEQKRRDVIEEYFREYDAPGWDVLLKYDGLLTQCQQILDAVVPDAEYRFRPLISPNASRSVTANVLSNISLAGSAQDRVPTIEVRDSKLILDSPVGMRRFVDVIKPGTIMKGVISIDNKEFHSHSLYDDVEFVITSKSEANERGDRYFRGELRSLKTVGEEKPRTYTVEGHINYNALSFSSTRDSLRYKSPLEEATFTGDTTKGTLGGLVKFAFGDGIFWFTPTK